MKTMLISYWGDRNKEAMKSLLLFGVKLTLNIGILYIAIVWILSPFLPRLYGIDSAALSSFTITACRITSFASVAYIFYGLFLDYYGVRGAGQGYVPFVAKSLADGRFVRSDASFSFPYGFKHGTILTISEEEYERIRAHQWKED